MDETYCSECNGEDLASICKWCHQDKIDEAKKQGALEELERLKAMMIELEKGKFMKMDRNDICLTISNYITNKLKKVGRE